MVGAYSAPCGYDFLLQIVESGIVTLKCALSRGRFCNSTPGKRLILSRRLGERHSCSAEGEG